MKGEENTTTKKLLSTYLEGVQEKSGGVFGLSLVWYVLLSDLFSCWIRSPIMKKLWC